MLCYTYMLVSFYLQVHEGKFVFFFTMMTFTWITSILFCSIHLHFHSPLSGFHFNWTDSYSLMYCQSFINCFAFQKNPARNEPLDHKYAFNFKRLIFQSGKTDMVVLKYHSIYWWNCIGIIIIDLIWINTSVTSCLLVKLSTFNLSIPLSLPKVNRPQGRFNKSWGPRQCNMMGPTKKFGVWEARHRPKKN